MKILCADVLKAPADIELKIFGEDAEIIIADAKNNNDISDDIWNSCNAILAYDQLIYNKACIDKLHNCKVIVRVGVGYDNVDLKYAKDKGIIVCNVPDYGTEEVADHTMALLLNLSRGIKKYTSNVENRNWDRSHDLPVRLRGKTLGIIGLGRIGTATAMRAKAFGLNIVYFDPYIEDGYDKALGLTRVYSLKDLAKQSKFISIHTPINNETKEILNQEFFNNLNPGTFLVNTARGGLVDIEALKEAMKKNIISACGLDVLPIEPNDDSQSLIVELEKQEDWIKNRLIITPHVAFYSPEAYVEMRKSAAAEALRVLEGSIPRNQLNQ